MVMIEGLLLRVIDNGSEEDFFLKNKHNNKISRKSTTLMENDISEIIA